MTRTISVDGRDLTISGRAGDPYFDNFNIDNHTADFLLYVARQRLRQNAVVFDVGANIGITAAILSTAAPDGQVFAFEPGADTYPHLLATIAVNKLSNCHPQQIALGASSGEADFFSNATSGSASHLASTGVSLGGSNTSVTMKTVDQVVSELELKRLDFIKIDVEGFELDVLEGAQSTLANLKPQVFLEFNSFTLIAYGNRNPRSVLEHLKATFPHVYRFDGGLPEEVTDESSLLTFIHDNLVKRACVDDLFCAFAPLL